MTIFSQLNKQVITIQFHQIDNVLQGLIGPTLSYFRSFSQQRATDSHSLLYFKELSNEYRRDITLIEKKLSKHQRSTIGFVT